MLAPAAAQAADSIAYNPTGGSEAVKNVAGVFYAGLLAFALYRLFNRRARKAISERIAQEREKLGEGEQPEEPVDSKKATPLSAAWGAAQTGFLTYLLYQLSTNVNGFYSTQALPDAYTARNISITVRTVAQGLAYLATFIFGANTLGLTGLAVQLAFWPDADKPDLSKLPVEADQKDQQ
eukprot:jgi/Astpho2/4812/Aster-x0214